ncbi:MAG: 4Fe-4S binding protein [Clostridia bacterium]|nr:4Fe-4S binding protein [Clostridia bacterium]
METLTALKMLVEEMHSAAVATIGGDGRPCIRVIDMMLYDDEGVYFLTAKGKEFYSQLMSQKYIALSAVKDKKSVSLRGYVKSVGKYKLDEIFAKNVYMQSIYPEGTRDALEVFLIYRASGGYFDISDPSNVTRGSFYIGDYKGNAKRYFVKDNCTGCSLCLDVCPQKCIDVVAKHVKIDFGRCLSCGNCIEICPSGAITVKYDAE